MAAPTDLVPPLLDLLNRDALRIPPYPAVAMRLREVISGDDFGVGDLERIVGEDPTLAATLLRYANSAIYRRVTPTTTLAAAITRIGSSEVARIALSLSMGAHAVGEGPLAGLRHRAWHASVMAALCCRAIAYWRKLDSDVAYVCGLLHDFGRIVAIAGFEDLLVRRKDQRVLPESAWADVVDQVHVSVGLAVAKRWNLSPLLCAVIGGHHAAQPASGHADLIDVVAAADHLVGLLEENVHPSAADLTRAFAMAADEAEYLVKLLPSMAEAVAALDETTELGTGESSGTPRQSVRPPRTLGGAHKAVSIGVGLLRSAGPLPGHATYLSHDGLVFTIPTKLRENCMIRLAVETPRRPLEVWAVVQRCDAEGAGFRIEARLFALAPELAEAWAQLYGSVG